MNTSRTRTPTKNYMMQSQQKPSQIMPTCQKIFFSQTQDEIIKYLIENKITTFNLKNQKCLNIINLSNHIFRMMVVENQGKEVFLNKVIDHFKNSSKKVYQFCRCLRHFATKDYEFQYIERVAKKENVQDISFYLKCRMAIVDSFLNKTKKELMINVIGDQEQWFKIVKKLFKNVRQQQIIDLYTDTIKYHYINIKKNQNEELNGSQMFRICQIMYRNIQANESIEQYEFEDREEGTKLKKSIMGDEEEGYNGSLKHKEKQAKRLFDKNVVDGLESEDRQLIRILSYKDNNIAKLLEQKHQKMIQLIVDDVEAMRRNIQDQKKKYIQLWNEKQEMLKAIESLNYLTISYISNDSVQNEQKLLKGIQSFNMKYRRNSETTSQIRKIKQMRKNKRLLEIIEREERQKD